MPGKGKGPINWLPRDKNVILRFLKVFKKKCEDAPKYKTLLQKILEYHPVIKNREDGGKRKLRPYVSAAEIKSLDMHYPVQQLYILIVTDPEVNMFFHQMFWQQCEDGIIDSWQVFISLLDEIMTYTPEYSDAALVGFPINALINWPMATTAGFACFLNDKVNNAFKLILNYWGKFLQSPASCVVLNNKEKGWFSPPALADMVDAEGNTFEQQFVCDSSKEHWGFTSWDDFFTRLFRPGIRPLPAIDNPNELVNACESAPYKIEEEVSGNSTFWIKEQPYSLDHMLNNNSWAEYFHGGTIYQAFLSALSYHRWHSPISGTIVETEIVDGSYYSQTYDIQNDYASPNMSQGYITSVAARGVIYIMADNPDIGVLGFISVGMSEVSSNEITVKKGQHVNKGDQLGMFHFGGSTHCLIFRPGVKVTFDLGDNEEPSLDAVNIPIHQKLATIALKEPRK